MRDKRRRNGRGKGDVWKGLAAGVAGGLVASVVMNQFQSRLGKLTAGIEKSHGAQSLQEGSPHHGIGRELEKRGGDDAQDDAAERLASAISVGVFDHDLTRSGKDAGGIALHYAYGISMGAFYGAAAELVSGVTAGAGLPYGALIWITADEGVIPALGLSKSSAEYPLSIHAYALASHLVYGLTTEVVRRAVRRAL
ncbi:MAG: DUF1440 domain-containing protein [Pyrinomonadaceae bacterium]|jgi:hypothetical protein|nr:DUF1440 domain-containing protein [Pyrinomonadaceae bacterium]MDQ3585541.1 DUF1440 domain-containing protein [Acidobacteriota bacterium]